MYQQRRRRWGCFSWHEARPELTMSVVVCTDYTLDNNYECTTMQSSINALATRPQRLIRESPLIPELSCPRICLPQDKIGLGSSRYTVSFS